MCLQFTLTLSVSLYSKDVSHRQCVVEDYLSSILTISAFCGKFMPLTCNMIIDVIEFGSTILLFVSSLSPLGFVAVVAVGVLLLLISDSFWIIRISLRFFILIPPLAF